MKHTLRLQVLKCIPAPSQALVAAMLAEAAAAVQPRGSGEGGYSLHVCCHVQRIVVAADEEEVLAGEAREAWFTVLKAAHKSRPRPGPYYARCASALLRSRRAGAMMATPDGDRISSS